jgi:hypothetical protein
MRVLKHEPESGSYMQLCLHLQGKSPIYLMVPTLWDEPNKQWIAFVQTPDTRKIISGKGKTSTELENSFNTELSECFEKIPDEMFSMFKPLEYWESRI